jgi:membrane protein
MRRATLSLSDRPRLRAAWALLKDTFTEWSDDEVPRLAAALAYYAVFSVAPMLVIVIAVAGFFYGPQAAEGRIVGQIETLVGTRGAEAIQVLLAGANHRSQGLVATVVGIVTLFFGATGFFTELQQTLNKIWNVEKKLGRSIWSTVRQRFASFALVLATAALLLVSLLAEAVLGAFTGYLETRVALFSLLSGPLSTLFGFALTTLVFALLFKVIPEVDLTWRDVWIGAMATSALFTLGRLGLGLYFGRSTFTSTYGAFGSLIVILFWIYYSAQIVFLGAEFTQVYSRRHGSKGKRASGSSDQAPPSRELLAGQSG